MTYKRVQDIVIEKMRNDPRIAPFMLDEIMLNLKNGEHDVAKLLLRDLVHATLGFEELAHQLDKPSKSLHRMLSARGNPTTSNLSAILACVSQYLEEVHETA
jgi:DNA-binding phage protein